MQTAEKAGSPLNESLYPAGIWKDFLLSHAGSLIGALELSGIDPNRLSAADRVSVSEALRDIIQSQHVATSITQYYWHFAGNSIELKDRESPRNHLLSKRRESFMNKTRTLSNSRLFWMLDVPSAANLNKLFSAAALRMIFAAPFDKKARSMVKAKFSNWGSWLIEQDELRRQTDMLRNSLQDLDAKLQSLSRANSQQTIEEMWALCRALVNLNPDYLTQGLNEAVPSDDWDRLLPDGDYHPVMVDGMPCLRFEGPETVYARIASITAYGGKQVPSGMWVNGDSMPVMLKGNYLAITRCKPKSSLEKALMLSSKENELYRSQMKFRKIMQGGDVEGEIENRVNQSKALSEKLQQLEDAEGSEDRFYTFHSHVILFEKDPSKLAAQSSEMNTALTSAKFNVVWESAGLMDLFPMLMPGYPKRCYRSAEFTSSQVAACSLAYRSNQGIKEWGEATKEEAVYVLENLDGTPFYYTPFIGDKALVLGVGPSRSGKTFFKNVTAGHFLKYSVPAEFDEAGNLLRPQQGSFYHSIDVDPGTEPLASFFKEDGGIFRLESTENDRGGNPFVMATGPDDIDFKHHMLTQIRIMLKLNDSEELRELTAEEQGQLDRALTKTLERPVELRNMSTLHTHCSNTLRLKLDRWVGTGMYARLFDNKEDGIGKLSTRIAVYNLVGVKDKPELAQLMSNEIFYRTTKLFENQANRRVPKILSIDEAQYFFSIPGAAERAVAKARTWFKWNGGMEFWTQSVSHFQALEEWDTLRSSASTFMFMADSEMDMATYKEAFKLTDGECLAIKKLIPRQQAYIIQREAGISKTVNIFTAPEEYVIATSRPSEAVIVQDMLKKHADIDVAVEEMVKRIKPNDRSKQA